MSPDHDPLFRALAGLPRIEPRPEWETRVRARCHAAIRRRASRRPGRHILDLAAAAGLSLYLAAVFLEAARLLH